MFQRDSRTELFLTRMGVKFTYSNRCRFDKLRLGWDSANRGRPKARVEDAILEYAAKMEDGSAAPAVIVIDTPDGFAVLDGVQRLSAALLGSATQFSAYIVQTDSERTKLAIRVFANQNLQGGHQESSAWTRRHAIELLIVQPHMSGEVPMSFEEVGKQGGWPTAVVNEDYTLMTWLFAIRKINGPGDQSGPNSLGIGVIKHLAEKATLHDLEKAPKPIGEFLTTLAKCKMVNGECNKLIDQFFEKPTGKRKDLHETYQERLDDVLSDPEIKTRLEGRAPQRRSTDTKLLAALKATLTVAKQAEQARHHIPYMDEYFQVWNQVQTVLKSIAKQKLQTTAK